MNLLHNSEKFSILQTPTFIRKKKKLKKNQWKQLDGAIHQIIKNPKIGVQKKGNLSDVWVYKFRILKQEILLAYQFDDKKIILLTFGVHENFYKKITK